METLDDSTKDPWNQENGSDAVDAEKPVAAPEKGTEDAEKKESLIASIRNYHCSIGKFLNFPKGFKQILVRFLFR